MTERDDALKELGRQITERRESIGMTLETVFDRTKIRPEYLRGIEEGDYTNFPEIVYIKGFVRTYLKLIGAEDMQDEFMSQLDRTQGTKKQDFHELRT
ncbi:MAG: helix-turn-helix domain-containing protein, partial [Synergistaceae bacterium]|nr:helix-turn-helix domain-containing protein [Synergistaceae bacterium]